MSDLEADLRKRWLPSKEQMDMADALLKAGYTAERGERRERGVYTAHLLLNKSFGLWMPGVELVFLDGVFLTRDAVLQYVHDEAERYFNEEMKEGGKLIGGWAWHPEPTVAAVWDDIMSQFPKQ